MQSVADVGTVFTLRFPLAQGALQRQRKSPPSQPMKSAMVAGL